MSALLSAAPNNPEAARLLLERGGDPNSFNTFGGMVKNGPIDLVHLTPLMVTAPYGDGQTLSLLLKAGARINEMDSRKMTPLMLAIATDHAKAWNVRRLLEAGADVQAKDKYGNSVLDWAHKFGNPEIVAQLVAAGAKGRESDASAAPASQLGGGECERSAVPVSGPVG